MIRFESIRTSKSTKLIISCLAINLIFAGIYPSAAWALPEGPTQPEFNSFTPIGASDMVDLTSGDFNYSIPVMDVGGYPLSLGYSSSANFDTPSSWVGHGWDLSAGQINRSMRVIPDDFDGTDKIKTENSQKDNTTVSLGLSANISIVGFDIPIDTDDRTDTDGLGLNLGLTATHNSHTGSTMQLSFGPSFSIHDKFDSSINFSPSSTEGVIISPSIAFEGAKGKYGMGLSFNSFSNSLSLNPSLSSGDSQRDNEKQRKGYENNGSGNLGILDLQPAQFNPAYNLGYTNLAGTVNFAGGLTFFGLDGKGEVYASVSSQSLKKDYEVKDHSAFGYNNNHLAGTNGLRDFTRSNDRSIGAGTSFLSVPQNNYDYYSVSGQGISGSFRPQNAQVGYVGDPKVENTSADMTLGAEIGGGNLFKIGGNISASFNDSWSGYWKKGKGNNANDILSPLTEASIENNQIDFKRNYFKMIGENTLKNEINNSNQNSFIQSIGSKEPVYFKRKRGTFSLSDTPGSLREIDGMYSQGELNFNTPIPLSSLEDGKIYSKSSIPTSKTIVPITIDEYNLENNSYGTDQYGLLNKNYSVTGVAKNHHQAGFKLTDDGGAIYNYDIPLYTKLSSQSSFSISGNAVKTNSGSQVKYSAQDNSKSNKKGRDHFFERRTIDPYVHTSLLRSILSPDYRDLEGNGVSPDDLGSYTLFKYRKLSEDSKFRFPIEEKEGLYNEGSKAMAGDDKASVTYGEKEQAFLDRIITKTHVAYFELNNDNDVETQRKDNLGVKGEDGGADVNQRSRYLNKIYLYTLAQAEKVGLLDPTVTGFNPNAHVIKPLKTAHFEYDYSIQNTDTGNKLPNSVNSDKGNGKLTLKKVYFTYGSSEMGRYTPYTFEYNQDTNFNYHNLNKDVWGNYQPATGAQDVNSDPTNGEFPYTDDTAANDNIANFLLSNIGLPSGGEINVSYEADDYAYVQDKKAMKMYRIAGVGNENDTVPNISFSSNKARLYSGDKLNDYLYLEIGNDIEWDNITDPDEKFRLLQDTYLDNLEGQPIYFKILSNLHKSSDNFSEYISGFVYLENLVKENVHVRQLDNNGSYYLSLQIQKPKLNGNSTSPYVHPFSKAAWNYSQSYLKSIAFDGQDQSISNLSPEGAARDLFRNLGSLGRIFSGPNRTLRSKGCGQDIFTNKSWLRLNEPTGFKKGGGARVARVEVDSNWDQMTAGQAITSEATSYYGQEYSYTSEDGSQSSGVAVNEPSLSDANALKLPLEDRGSRSTSTGAVMDKLIDKFLAPARENYIIGPLMSDYYPNPSVTYSRVKVMNIKPAHTDQTNSNLVISSRATGYVVNEFYTSKDFPTIEKNTMLDSKVYETSDVERFIETLIGFPADIYSGKKYIGTQGFYVETNDMDGKSKSQTVYAEKAIGNDYITKSTYEYKVDENGNLDNTNTFIENDGSIKELEVGVDYDVVNDFRYSSSKTYSGHVDGNAATMYLIFTTLTIPLGLSGGSFHETQSRIATTAKHVHRTGIMKSSTVTDNGSTITTENLAFDYYSRQPILKMVNNEFNDVIYNFDYPAYWAIDEMGNKSINEGITFKGLTLQADRYTLNKNVYNDNSLPLLIDGDEVKIIGDNTNTSYWIHNIAYSSGNTVSFNLIDKDAFTLDSNLSADTLKIVRSAYDNKQAQSIASISMSKNPIREANGTLKTSLPNLFDEEYAIYNASAIEMKGLWEPDCECGYNELPRDDNGDLIFDLAGEEVNPYFNNIIGQYRPWRSYAYLTGRETVDAALGANLRKDGFYRDFTSFYAFENVPGIGIKLKKPNYDQNDPLASKFERWQFASEVSKISPYGLELENKDPLEDARYSSAMYGFNKKFPTAVASNTEYRELAFDSFEDYDYIEHDDEHFAFAKALVHTQNASGTFTQGDTIIVDDHITDKEHHTGNYSFEINSGGSVGLNIVLEKDCIEITNGLISSGGGTAQGVVDPNAGPAHAQLVGEKYLALVQYIWDNADTLQNIGCHSDPTTIPQFSELVNYITDVNGLTPSICDVQAIMNTVPDPDIPGNTITYQDDITFSFFPGGRTNLFRACGVRHPGIHSDAVIVNPPIDLELRPQLNGFYNQPYGRYNYIMKTFKQKPGTCGSNDASNYFDPSYYNDLEIGTDTICLDCTSFAPHQSYDYVVSAWVKEDIDRSNLSNPQELRDAYPAGYQAAKVTIAFTDINGQSTTAPLSFAPSGQIINGWQKVYGTFTVDSNANIMKVLLNNTSETRSAFFDDIRIHPVNGSMKSFVYDDESFRLKAELDDNNYATFYEYDLEGNLIRIKKETSRGIMTIQESRQSLIKQIPQQ